MRKLGGFVAVLLVASACHSSGPTDSCDLSPCLGSEYEIPWERSAVCDWNYPDTPGRRDHCVIYDGREGVYGKLRQNCEEPWREDPEAEGYMCAPLKDPFIGGDQNTCVVEGVPARCMWVDTRLVELYGTGS